MERDQDQELAKDRRAVIAAMVFIAIVWLVAVLTV